MSLQNSNVSNTKEQSSAKPNNEKAHHLASMIDILQKELDGLQDNESDSESSSSEAKSEKTQESDANRGNAETLQGIQWGNSQAISNDAQSLFAATEERIARSLTKDVANIDTLKLSTAKETANGTTKLQPPSDDNPAQISQIERKEYRVQGMQDTAKINKPEVFPNIETRLAKKSVERDISPLAAVTPISIDLAQSPVSMLSSPTGNKVKIRFSPIGSITPLNKMIINASQPFSVIINFVKRKTNRKHVYLYINNSFAPSGQQLVGELYEHFRVNDELWVSYCGGVAFG
ncbi:hypothetical protein ACO0QE_003689 [Hanseniaspora vineae]